MHFSSSCFPMRNLQWSLSSIHAAWQPGCSSPSVMVTIQHFVFVQQLPYCFSLPVTETGLPLPPFTFHQTFFSFWPFPHLPNTYSGLHSHKHTLPLTHLQTISCLLWTDNSPLLAGAHSLDYYSPYFCSSTHVCGHMQHYKYKYKYKFTRDPWK